MCAVWIHSLGLGRSFIRSGIGQVRWVHYQTVAAVAVVATATLVSSFILQFNSSRWAVRVKKPPATAVTTDQPPSNGGSRSCSVWREPLDVQQRVHVWGEESERGEDITNYSRSNGSNSRLLHSRELINQLLPATWTRSPACLPALALQRPPYVYITPNTTFVPYFFKKGKETKQNLLRNIQISSDDSIAFISRLKGSKREARHKDYKLLH